ncbi:MAG: FAD-dependent oxidoreductase [Pirellulales bacterium]
MERTYEWDRWGIRGHRVPGSWVTQFLEDHLVGQFEHRRHQRCFYTMTQDHHFWIDQNPNDPNLFVMGGFSGHGFKFASVLGKCLVRWALQDDRDDRLQLFATRA